MRKTCLYCGKRRLLATNRLKGVDPSVYAEDPYCSRTCAEADYQAWLVEDDEKFDLTTEELEGYEKSDHAATSKGRRQRDQAA